MREEATLRLYEELQGVHRADADSVVVAGVTYAVASAGSPFAFLFLPQLIKRAANSKGAYPQSACFSCRLTWFLLSSHQLSN